MRLLHASLLLAAVSFAGRTFAGEPGPVPPPPADDKAKGPEHNVTLSEEPGVLELLNKAQKARARAEKDAEVWPEVVKFYSEILKKYPNTVYLDRWEGPDKTEMAWKNGLYKSTRERVARDIASLPPGGLATYRVINDPAARNLFLEAQDQFDERKMEQVAQEFFPTSFGDDAMAWLAEISHDRGAPRQAVLRLDQALKHPSPTIPKTAALARIVLSYAEMGQRPAAEKALADLEQAVNDPKNGALRLGHSEGADALAKLKDRVSKIVEKKGATPANLATGGGWETYFGNAAHNRFLPTRKNVGLRKWSAPIAQLLEGPGADTSGASKILNADGTPIIDPTMNYHLVSKDGFFYLCNANSIAAYPTGNPQPGLSSAGGNVKFFFPNDAQPAVKPKESNKDRVMRARFGRMAGAGVRHHPYFVTLAGDRLYAVLGAEANTLDPDMWRGQEIKQQANYLVSLGYQSGKLIWSLQPDVRSQFFDSHSKADQEWLKSVFFASAPVYESGVLYVLAVQSHGLNDAWAAAFDADNGRLLWRTQICSANAYTVGGPVQPDLALPVAVANGTVYAVTNLGAVAAIDAMSGNIKWLRVYDRQQVVDRFNNRGMRVASDFWGPNAPVVHENLLIVTPQDSDFLYAYDIETGKRVWEISRTEREGSNLKHVLGISNGALVVTGQNIQFFQMKGGAALGDANNPILFDSPIKGRGIVTENMVLIPTEKALVSIDTTLDNNKFRPKVSKVTPWTQPEVEAGNLVIAGDVLYSVSRTHVNAYFVWEEMEARLKDRIKKDANDLGAYSELADVYHKVDKFDLALAELDKALELVAKQKDDPKAAATKEELLRKKFDALYAQGDKSQNKPVANKADLTAAYDWYKQAYGVANGSVLPPALAVKALRAMAENAFLQLDKKLAVDHYQHIITDHGDVVYNYQADSSSKARLFAQARIAEIRKTNPEAYEKQDADAKAAFTKAGNDIKQLEAVLATWPNSNTCGAAMLKLAHLAIASSPDQARQYALTFLGRYPATPDTANANVLLAVAYEKSNLLGPAKDVLRRLSGRKELAEQPVTIDPTKPGENLAAPVKAAEWASKRLAEPQFQRTPSAATMSLGDGKLKQSWTRPANAQSVPVLARGIAPYDMRKNLFYVENASELAVLSSSDRGEEIWTPRPKLPVEVLPKPNQQDPQRFALYQNVMGPQAVWSERLLIFVGAREVVAYDSREKGKVVWRTDLKLPSPQQRCAIQVSYGRLVIGYPSGALCVLDAATGEQLWQTQVEGNQLTGVPTAGDGFVAVAAQNPARVYLYDLETGNRRGAIDVAAGSLTVQPEALGDRLFFAERNMLKAIDGNSGKLVWEKDCGGNITRLEAERELVATVIDGRRVAAVTIEQQGESKLWSPVLERDVTIRDLYIDGDDLYVVFTSPDRRSGLSSHSVRLQGKKQWEAELSTAQLDALQIGPATVGANHLMVTQSNWDPTGDKPAAVVLIDRKTGKLTWAESLGSEHRTLDADNMAHPAFTAQMFDGGVVITESKKRSAFTVPDQVNIEETIKSLQEQLAKKTDDIGLRARLALKQYEKGSVDEAMKNLAEALGNKAITDEQFTTTFADFSRLRAEISRKQKRTFNFIKIADASKLDTVPETVLSSWRDIYFPSDDETSGAIKKNLWNGPDDLKVSFRGGWDDKNLYLLFTVTDDKHKNEQTDGTYCDVGDSVKVAFDIDRDGGMGYRGEDFAFGAAFSEKAPTPVLGWRWVEHGQYLSGATPLAPLPEVTRKEAEKQTLYKLIIPLTYLTLKPEAGKKFGFSFVINDQDDGTAVTKSIGASPGLVGAPFPGLFAEGVLLEK